MRKLIIAAFVAFPLLVIGQTQSENYVKSTTYKVPTQTGNVSSGEDIETVNYYDGLGRMKQSIVVGSRESADGSQATVLNWNGNWKSGVGSTGIFSAYGSTSENRSLAGTTPFGGKEILWRAG